MQATLLIFFPVILLRTQEMALLIWVLKSMCCILLFCYTFDFQDIKVQMLIFAQNQHNYILFLDFKSLDFDGREVDEALRPGVYALIDICTPTDLQRLHTVLGGQCS